jgi:serine/threonine protein kinase
MIQCPTCGAQNPQGASQCRRCGVFLSLYLPVGTKLGRGAYTVGKMLGQGGFGITYMGSDTRLHRVVAIKEFFPPGCIRQGTAVSIATPSFTPAEFEGWKQRFLQEARTLARFNHPGIVRVYDVFEENRTAYIIMEFLRGKPLSRILEERGGRMDEQEAVGYIAQVCESLELVHSSGILHRDIKPDNIMVCEDGRVVLIDFGAAREFAAKATQRHTIVLTHGYAPMEQYSERGQRGPFTDIYALSATLYHLLTGEVPVAAPERMAGLPLPDVRQLNPRVSPAVAQAIMQGLEMEGHRRPQTARDFLNLLRGRGTAAPVTPTPTPAPTTSQAPQIDELLKNILLRLYGLSEKAYQEGMVIDCLWISRLKEEVAESMVVRLEQGKHYLVAGTGDNRVITDLDARVYDPDGRVVGEDTLKDNLPTIDFRASKTGPHKITVWAHEMEGEEGFYAVVVGHQLTSSDEQRVMSVWEGIFERFLALVVVAAQAGFLCLYAELDTVGERFTRTMGTELEGGHDYLIVAAGDEVHIADLDMSVKLPDGRTMEDRGPDNVPKVDFHLNRTGRVEITLIPARMHQGYEKGYYALFIGRK